MKLVPVRERCPDRVTCPTLYRTDRGTYVIQGDRNTDLDRTDGEDVAEIPSELIPEIADHGHDDLHVTERDSVLVRGTRVTDPEAQATMQLPDWETAVEIAAQALPELKETTDA